jgi:transposase
MVGSRKGGSMPKDVEFSKLTAIADKAKALGLSSDEHDTLRGAIDTLGFLTHEIERKDTSLAKLRKYLFGESSERRSDILPGEDAQVDGEAAQARRPATTESGSKKANKGHGRNGADAYAGATKVAVPHATLRSGDPCPNVDCNGKVYTMQRPATLVRVTGMAPLTATVYELEKLRCSLCLSIFEAEAPPEVGRVKYDEAAASMVALLKYGAGMPFNRIQQLQKGLGIPFPTSTQWDVVADASMKLLPAYQELVRQAAQGEVIHSDDTTMKILELTGERRKKAIEAGDIEPTQRVGIFTSGLLSRGAVGCSAVSTDAGASQPEIALFFTGTQHAGENLADVLRERADDLSAPIHMCDALSQNTAGEFEAILSRCLVHARRNFVEVLANFPEECARVINDLAEVYRTDTQARKENLSPEERLSLHQAESAPRLAELKQWLAMQIDDRLVEPNSGLGKAIDYMRKHWEGLTLFLRKAGAPLDNNTCERALKKAVLHRKNAYFYKTRNGARIGDLYMSLIHTAERCGVSPFDYLTAIQRHATEARRDPAQWMPWNFTAALAEEAAPSTGDA